MFYQWDRQSSCPVRRRAPISPVTLSVSENVGQQHSMPGIRHKNGTRTHSLPPRSETDCATYASFNCRLPLRFKACGITKEGNRWAVEPIREDTSLHVRYKSGAILAGSSLFWRQRASFHSLQPKPLPALVLTAHLSLWSLAGRQGQNRLPG